MGSKSENSQFSASPPVRDDGRCTQKPARVGARGRTKGIAVLWMALTLVVLVLFMGFSIDGAIVYLGAHQLQNAADAAALAGARIVRLNQDQARAEAVKFADLNYCLGDEVQLNPNGGNDPEGDIVVGRFYYDERGFVPLQDLSVDVGPDALKVVAKRTENEHGAIPLFFGPIANVDTANVSRVTVAQALGGWGAGIITLDCYAQDALSIPDAAVDVTIAGGGIQVNSEHDEAFTANRNALFDPIPEIINVHGGVDKLPEELYDVVTTGAPRQPDPLCPDAQCDGSVSGGDCLPEPDFGPPIQPETVDLEPNETRTIQPGYYPGGIKLLSSDETLLLDPGIYILDGEGLYINGGNLIGEDVMLYITGDGRVDMQGNGVVQLNQNNEFPGYPFPPFEGMTIYQDRDNDNPAVIQGTNSLDIAGTIYFPRNHVKITGTGDGFGTQLIANTIEIRGHGLIEINYDGRNPFPANRSIIVW